jgi:hypothetical protein
VTLEASAIFSKASGAGLKNSYRKKPSAEGFSLSKIATEMRILSKFADICIYIRSGGTVLEQTSGHLSAAN